VLRAAPIIVVLVASCLFISAQSNQRTHASSTKDCYDTAHTQSALNECAAGKLSKADAELKVLYDRLLAKASDPSYHSKVEAAQKTWIAYRDAELEAKYPAGDKQTEYGSVYSMCLENDRAKMIQQRIQELRALLREGEGDVCAGEWTGPTR
jgi:uncharacterized protein YecT (DUF1311 family)